ncbi:MAG: ChaN family lipoprotein, partial [Cyanobacteria bacterium Co-bin13]|nr:ChaN family lipoprotein [Cyanobacteria bacterium Co-bin13]
MQQPLRRFVRLVGWLILGCLCLWLITLARVQPPTASLASAPTQAVQASLSQPSILAELATADVIYLGETHSRPADHAAQLEIIQALVAGDR